jgi:hypothetical protein
VAGAAAVEAGPAGRSERGEDLMSTGNEPPDPTPAECEGTAATPAHLAYAGASRVATAGDAAEVELFGNLDRPPVRYAARVKDPLRFREAISALYAVVGSDYRYVPKDRTAYLAYLRLKRETAGQTVWKAQQAYFAWLLRNDPLAYCILDPVITVHPDKVLFEVFGKDESTYACLAFDRRAFDDEAAGVDCGTTNIDFSRALYDGVQRMRGYKPTKLSIGGGAVAVATEAREVIEKQIRVPDSWLRGFLQVQSAATLPFDHCRLAPVDVYNLLRELRLHADVKGKRRGLRFELVPAETPRLVLEPHETVLTGTGDVFRGRAARVVRVWGRRRLMTARRLLPYVEAVDVHLLGSGLPSFWVFRAGDVTLTLGLTGFTAANWSQALGFDLLLPRKTQTPAPLKAVVDYLAGGVLAADAKTLAAGTGVKGSVLLEALQLGCQQGQLMYDIAAGVYRLRPVVGGPLDLARLQYRNQREKVAIDLLSRRGAVRVVSENRIAGQGLELTGEVSVAEDRRDYRPQMLLADEGQVKRAVCTCTAFRKQGLKAGPCVHLIALRLAYADREAMRAKSDDAVTFEMRAFTRRDGGTETVVQVSLERRQLRLRWGTAGQPMRVQALRFNTESAARAAYFARLTELGAKGYLDAVAE